jgi:hypothetical protein
VNCGESCCVFEDYKLQLTVVCSVFEWKYSCYPFLSEYQLYSLSYRNTVSLRVYNIINVFLWPLTKTWIASASHSNEKVASPCFICYCIRHIKIFECWCCLGFCAMWFRRSVPTFRRNMSSPASGLKLQGRKVEGLYRIWWAKAEGREPISAKEYGKGSGPIGSLQASGKLLGGRGYVGSGVREETALFRAHRRMSCSCLEPVFVPLRLLLPDAY